MKRGGSVGMDKTKTTEDNMAETQSLRDYESSRLLNVPTMRLRQLKINIPKVNMGKPSSAMTLKGKKKIKGLTQMTRMKCPCISFSSKLQKGL